MSRFLPALPLIVLAAAAPAQEAVFGEGVDISDTDTTQADLFVTGDTVLDDSVCIGNACTEAEVFPESTLLRITNTAIRVEFIDTSFEAGTFPSNDWALQINDGGSGGLGRFSIADLNDGTVPFTVEAGAPENALWITELGTVGLGTMLPRDELHILSASFPAVTLEQDTSGGLPAADYRISASHNGIAIAENQFTVFQLEEGLLPGSFAMKPNGDLGLGVRAVGSGTETIDAPLHVLRDDNRARVLVEDYGASGAQEMFKLSNNGGSYFTFENTDAGTTWFFNHENAAPNRFIIADAVADGPEMSLTADGDLTIPGQLFTGGSCAAGCDRVFDEDYPLPTIAEQAALMRAKKHLPAVGPTPEDGPFNITAMTGGMLNELEKAHLYIAEQQERLDGQDRTIAAQGARIARLEAQIDALLARP
ncbi:hypothetical protein ACOXXX_18400 [Thalassococcus sp. BH17M4-6]|uniref:hypothetical protein n=1 Tax=Thalassococcus sp. BH17M4-6 TaxID=3413148 RepID=UPI003BDFD3B7